MNVLLTIGPWLLWNVMSRNYIGMWHQWNSCSIVFTPCPATLSQWPMALFAAWTVSVIAAASFINVHSYGVRVGNSFLVLPILGFIFCITFGIVSICIKVAEGLATESDKCLTELKRKVWGKGLKTGQTRRHVPVLRRNSTWGSIRHNRRTIRCPVWFFFKIQAGLLISYAEVVINDIIAGVFLIDVASPVTLLLWAVYQ